MRRNPKRKLSSSPSRSKEALKSSSEPYPNHPFPTPEQCQAVRDALLSHHGFPEEFAKYKRSTTGMQRVVAGSNGETVLDGLVSTLLSQNTTESNSRRAFESLKSSFSTWDQVLTAESKLIEDSIRCGGLAATKAARIKNILKSLKEEKGILCLEYLRCLSVDEIKAELSKFKGIGPKTVSFTIRLLTDMIPTDHIYVTVYCEFHDDLVSRKTLHAFYAPTQISSQVACILMFHLQRDDFPVDTHVYRITRDIGWIPIKADREQAYLHLNNRIPNELKFDLNCLLVTHGRHCRRCAIRGSIKKTVNNSCAYCPLSEYSKNRRE